MPSPNVGKVTLGVEIDIEGLRSKLSESVLKEVLPVIEKYNAELALTKHNIDAINAKPLEEVAKMTNMAAKETAVMAREKERLARLEKDTDKLAEKRIQTTKAQAAANRALTREMQDNNGKATKATEEAARKAIAANDAVKEAQERNLKDIELLQQKMHEDWVKRATSERDQLAQIEADKVRIQRKGIDSSMRDWVAQSKPELDKLKEDNDKLEREGERRSRILRGDPFGRGGANPQSWARNISNIVNLGGLSAGALAGVFGLFEQLAQVAANLSGVLGLLPGAFAAAGMAAGTFALATDGIGAAIKDIDTKNFKQLAVDIQDLAPSAQQFVLAIGEAMPYFEQLKQSVQGAFFDGLAEQLFKLTNTMFPMIKASLTDLSSVFNDVIMRVTNELMTPQVMGELKNTMNSIVQAFRNLEPAVKPVVDALAKVFEVSAGFMPQLANILTALITEFSTWLNELASNGSLGAWIQEGINTAMAFIPVIKDIFNLFAALGQGGNGIITVFDHIVNFMTWIVENGSAVVKVFETIAAIWAANKLVNLGVGMVLGLDALSVKIDILKEKWAESAAAKEAAGAVTVESIAAESAAMDKLVLNATAANDAILSSGFKVSESIMAEVEALTATAAAAAEAGGAVTEALSAEQLAALDLAEAVAAVNAPLTALTDMFLTSSETVIGAVDLEIKAMEELALAIAAVEGAEVKAAGAIVAAAPEVITTLEAETGAALNLDRALAAAGPAAAAGAGGAAAAGAGGGLLARLGLGGGIGSLFNMAAIPLGAAWGADALTNLFTGGNAGVTDGFKATWSMITGDGIPQWYKDKEPGLFPKDPLPVGTALDGSGQGLTSMLTPGSATSPGIAKPDLNLPNLTMPAGGLPVPGAPPLGPDGKPLSQSAIDKAAIDEALKNQAPFDPFAGIGGVQNQPGYPGKAPLGVTVTNLPAGGMGTGTPGFAAPAGIGLRPINMAAPSVDGEHQQITDVLQVAQQFGLATKGAGIDFSGNYTHPNDGLNHPKGMAGDFSDGTQTLSANKLAFANFMKQFSPYLAELIYGDPSFQGPFQYSQGLLDQHKNHVHVGIKDGMAPQFEAALAQVLGMGTSPVPVSLKEAPGTVNSAPVVDPATGKMGYFKQDPEKVSEAEAALRALGPTIDKLKAEIDVYTAQQAKGVDVQDKLSTAQNEYNKIMGDGGELQKKQQELLKAQRGTFEDLPNQKQQPMDYSKLPFGDPRKIMAGAIQGAGGSSADVAALLGQSMGAAVADGVSTQVFATGTPTAPTTDTQQLIAERNPMAAAAAAGYNVPDYTRAGGGPGAQDTQPQTAPPVTATGQITSDTAAQIDRTMTNMEAANQARQDQLLSVLNDIKSQVAKEVLGPVVEKSVTAGLNSAAAEIGKALGDAAGPPIADAVSQAVASSSNSQPSTPGLGLPGMASGGPITGGTTGMDSVPAMLMPGEWVLTAAEVQRLGGFTGVDRFREALGKGSVRYFATGGAVTGNPNGGANVNSTVGADFFGVSQIPVLAEAINLLVDVLLQVIGVQIMSRDSLIEVSKDFKAFRGDFKAYDAAGRIKNDTAGLVDRTSSSEKQAADERIRILKLVIDGIVKYIIEKIVVPISKAIANAIIQAGAGAAAGALGAAFPGGSIVGGIASAAISAAGAAMVDIAASIFTIAAETAFSIGVAAIGEALQTLFPQLTTSLFSGAGMEAIVGPISQALIGLTGGITVLLGNIGGLLSGVTNIIPTLSGLLSNFTPLTGALAGVVGVLGSIASVLYQILAALQGLGASITAPIVNAIAPLVNVLMSLTSNMGGSVNLLGSITGILNSLLQGFTSFFPTIALPTGSINPAAAATATAVGTVTSLVTALNNNTTSAPKSTTTTINAPITVTGTVNTAQAVSTRLLALI